jgi:uncharacterized membrane protein YeaQ/YmgE (transglycosylase-associated protein family)
VTAETLVIIWVISGLVGGIIGQAKGRTGAGVALGLLLGVIGVLIAALLPKRPEKHAAEINAMHSAFRVAPVTAAQWAPDPLGRFAQRYWNGDAWTDHVAEGEQQAVDPIYQ